MTMKQKQINTRNVEDRADACVVIRDATNLGEYLDLGPKPLGFESGFWFVCLNSELVWICI